MSSATAAAGPPYPGPSTRPADIASWLDQQETDLTHPKVVEDRLLRAGWHPIAAAATAANYRHRFNEHPLGYVALLVSTGVAALAAGSVGHALASALQGPVNRNSLASWLTILLVSMPFAVWAHLWAAGVDRNDPVAVWSQSRRSLGQALVWGVGVVGIARLALYGGRLAGSLVGATWARSYSVGAGLANVAITVVIALPLGLWAFHFLHRFDGEDPAQPRLHRRRSR